MDQVERLRRWAEANRDIWIDVMRIYLGIGLMVKGISFLARGTMLMETMQRAEIGYATGLIAHYVILAHIAGGLLLAVGLLTRGAAVMNIPVLLGAVLFAHRREGLFAPAQTLEFACLVLALLVVLTIAGGGRLSVDYLLKKEADARLPHDEGAHAPT
jgi:putative oxidoreductase